MNTSLNPRFTIQARLLGVWLSSTVNKYKLNHFLGGLKGETAKPETTTGGTPTTPTKPKPPSVPSTPGVTPAVPGLPPCEGCKAGGGKQVAGMYNTVFL